MTAVRAREVTRVLITALVLSAGFAIAYLISDKNPLLAFVVLLATGVGLGVRNGHPLGIPLGGLLGGILIEALWRATHDTSGESPNSLSFSIELGLALSLVAALPGWLLGRAFIKATDQPAASLRDPAAPSTPSPDGPTPDIPNTGQAPSVHLSSIGDSAVLLAATALAILFAVFVLFYWFASNLLPPDYAG
jgi:hypothetical protein